MERLLAAIVEDNWKRAESLLLEAPSLSRDRLSTSTLYQSPFIHWIYPGDTPLHLAAAGRRASIARLLLEAGADPNAAANPRRSTPLHYAADGVIAHSGWSATRQVETIDCLLAHGADLNRQDKNGATPLHRAVRTRCAAAVDCLLRAGANPLCPNRSGSTPFHLAVQNTGRGGSGTDVAVNAQRQIIEQIVSLGVSPDFRIGCRKSVRESARSRWIVDLLG